MKANSHLFAFVFIIALPILVNGIAQAAVTMDVKCTVYSHSDDVNGNKVDVRTLVLGLKSNSDYTAQVIPDHNTPTNVTTKTDSEGIFWAVAKILNGESSTLFKVKVYEDKGAGKQLVASGDDDAPCYEIVLPSQISK